mmetsp:Transcript_29898/g.58639  ORF Transcript_29898/g.58639 Transcript_29898/m.58639 type:complete len:207 (+) Transcript_29898:472-1092(+)
MEHRVHIRRDALHAEGKSSLPPPSSAAVSWRLLVDEPSQPCHVHGPRHSQEGPAESDFRIDRDSRGRGARGRGGKRKLKGICEEVREQTSSQPSGSLPWSVIRGTGPACEDALLRPGQTHLSGRCDRASVPPRSSQCLRRDPGRRPRASPLRRLGGHRRGRAPVSIPQRGPAVPPGAPDSRCSRACIRQARKPSCAPRFCCREAFL